jgi:hypothetical protein
MEQQTLYSRWHCFDEQGVKYIKNCSIGERPAPEGNLTEWKRGTGPFSPVQLNNLRAAVTKACKGVPKSPITKQRMSLAKLGVPKSPEHKQAMKSAWARRRLLISHNHYDDTKKTNPQPTL